MERNEMDYSIPFFSGFFTLMPYRIFSQTQKVLIQVSLTLNQKFFWLIIETLWSTLPGFINRIVKLATILFPFLTCLKCRYGTLLNLVKCTSSLIIKCLTVDNKYYVTGMGNIFMVLIIIYSVVSSNLRPSMLKVNKFFQRQSEERECYSTPVCVC